MVPYAKNCKHDRCQRKRNHETSDHRPRRRARPSIRATEYNVAPLQRIEIFGSGAAWATASEAALKIKEACYIAAEGFETEEILHGPFSETDARGSLAGAPIGPGSTETAGPGVGAGRAQRSSSTAAATPASNP